ncbi:phosphate ABC transporter permease PstA [Compostimonas suwonensis]|uniref:Phosphate transport system permease protein PstA n=1 Tax=Compostimonas suwonensis TaxID=1048394 RepID=A0A2M9C052_9MICO|nr:phosphate ABC transporter permease PstA [Compostimonas suwonensis]PJJ63716.1 phosphate transport system permease protein [Compostimonas suwonensis]
MTILDEPRTRRADEQEPGDRPATRADQRSSRRARTSLPARERMSRQYQQKPETKRNLATIRRSDVFKILGAFAAAVATATWLFTQVMPLEGELGFVALSYVLFLGFYTVLISFDDSRVAVKDRLSTVFAHSIAILLILALAVVVFFTFARGAEALVHWNFFVQDFSNAGPLDPLDVGGIFHAAVGTLIMISIALVISIPLGILCAVFLSEIPGRFSSFVRTIVEAMTALPSIVAGLFIYATVIVFLGFDRSGFAAALAITVMMLPIIIRAADVVLRLVPGNLKEASLALGAGQWRTVWHVVLPTTRSGLTTAIILGTARGIGETSPVLLTAGYTTYLSLNPFSGPMVSLPLATFNLVKSPEPSQIARGFGAAAVLMLLVLVLFLVARVIGGRGPGQLTRRQQQARLAQSRSDAARFEALDRANLVETSGYAGMGFQKTGAAAAGKGQSA